MADAQTCHGFDNLGALTAIDGGTMPTWRRGLAAMAIAVAALGVAGCDNDPEDADQIEEQVDELEQDVRENTP